MSGSANRAPEGPEVVLRLGGHAFRNWTGIEIGRDLTEISGSFQLEYFDRARAKRGLPKMDVDEAEEIMLRAGQEARIEVDGELVLLGWVDLHEVEIGDSVLSCTISGRDRTGDLVDCDANPTGPAEYKGMKLDAIARELCKPFGITVRAEVDVGEPFPRFSIDTSERVMSALSKAAKQRQVLLVSDGVGGLVITRSGSTRGPDALRLPGNVHRLSGGQDWKQRYSDYYVKAQAEKAAGHRTGRARLSADVQPLPGDPGIPPGPSAGAAPAATTPAARRRGSTERRGIVMTGHARDPEVTRYRPKVEHPKTQSGGFSAQQLADWRMRTSRGESEALKVTLIGWRHGADRRLWRPNEVVLADIPFLEEDHDVLISAVTMTKDDRGSMVVVKVGDPEAFEPEHQGERRRRGRAGRRRKPAGGRGAGGGASDVQSLPGDG